MKKRDVFISFLTGIALGVAVVIFLLERDNHVHRYAHDTMCSIFATSFAGNFSGSVQSIGLFRPSITFGNVAVRPFDHAHWSWQAATLTIRFSWLQALLTGKINLLVTLDGIDAQSLMQGSTLAILDHLQRFIFNDSPVPVGLRSLALRHVQLQLLDKERALATRLFFDADAAVLDGEFNVKYAIRDGSMVQHDECLLRSVAATVDWSIGNYSNPTYCLKAQGTFATPRIAESLQFACGWQQGKGSCSIKNNAGTFSCAFDDIMYAPLLSLRYTMNSPLPILLQIFKSKLPVTATGAVAAQGTLHNGIVSQGSLSLDDSAVNGIALGSLRVEHTHDGNRFDAHGNFYHRDVACLAMHAGYDMQHACGAYDMQSTASWKTGFFDWIIQPAKTYAQGTIKQNHLDGAFAIGIAHAAANTQSTIAGTVQGSLDACSLQVQGFDHALSAQVSLYPSQYLKQLRIINKAGQEFFTLKTKEHEPLHGMVRLEYSALQPWIFNYSGLKIPGQGALIADSKYADGALQMRIGLRDANILLPETYNYLKRGTMDLVYDFTTKTCTISNALLGFDKGLVQCKRALIALHDDGTFRSVFAPCSLNQLFINKERDFFAVVSGALLFEMHPAKNPSVRGSLIIDRSALKKNIFSTSGQTTMFPTFALAKEQKKELALDIAVQSKAPLLVKTPFIEAAAHVHVAVHGTLDDPHISGNVALAHGSLAFPYKPLTITHGAIYFLPHQLHDPMIELVAKGKIRKYHIVMRCTGSLKQPHILFESSPPLTEEQIITLLLSGSEEGALSLAMPAMAMQQLQNLIVGSEEQESKTRLERYFKSLLGPLRHIHFVPIFADQTARGGFRGAIVVDVNDQLRGMIQKNFSLTEDFKIEVEYNFADDITLRGIRDERGDLGCEVEVRLKF